MNKERYLVWKNYEALSAAPEALTEIIDGGAKNLIKNSNVSQTLNGVNFTVNSDGTVIVNGTATALVSYAVNTSKYPSGQYALSGCPKNGSNTTYRLDIVDYTTGTPVVIAIDTGNGASFELSDDDADYRTRIRIASGQTVDNLVFKPMLCTKAAWDISHQYVPYRPSYDELVARVEALKG